MFRFRKTSKVPNKRGPPLIFFEKNPTPPLLLGPPPPRLLIFGFSSLPPKKFEQFKTYLSIRNSIKSNEIDFYVSFRFQCYFQCYFSMKFCLLVTVALDIFIKEKK